VREIWGVEGEFGSGGMWRVSGGAVKGGLVLVIGVGSELAVGTCDVRVDFDSQSKVLLLRNQGCAIQRAIQNSSRLKKSLCRFIGYKYPIRWNFFTRCKKFWKTSHLPPDSEKLLDPFHPYILHRIKDLGQKNPLIFLLLV
jgi:hypothetical protein